MIADLITFLVDKWRRKKYSEDYENEAKIKADAKNHIIRYQLKGKETYATYQWPNLVVTSIELWSTGEPIAEKDKSLILIDLLDHIFQYAGKKAIVLIDKKHPDKEFWEQQALKLKYNIEKVELFDKEEKFQAYIDELAKAFEKGKSLEIEGKVITNRDELEKALRDK